MTVSPFDLAALVRTELAAELGDGVLATDPDVVGSYSTDQALFCPADGAIALVRARTVADVQATMRFATRHRVPVVPQGARTGLSGGANAVPGCLLLSLERMDRVLEVDAAERLPGRGVEEIDLLPCGAGPDLPVDELVHRSPFAVSRRSARSGPRRG